MYEFLDKIPQISPLLLYIINIVLGLIAFVCSIIILVRAFQKSIGWGFGMLFLPLLLPTGFVIAAGTLFPALVAAHPYIFMGIFLILVYAVPIYFFATTWDKIKTPLLTYIGAMIIQTALSAVMLYQMQQLESLITVFKHPADPDSNVQMMQLAESLKPHTDTASAPAQAKQSPSIYDQRLYKQMLGQKIEQIIAEFDEPELGRALSGETLTIMYNNNIQFVFEDGIILSEVYNGKKIICSTETAKEPPQPKKQTNSN